MQQVDIMAPRAKAFEVASQLPLAQLRDIRDAIEDALRLGLSLCEFRARVNRRSGVEP